MDFAAPGENQRLSFAVAQRAGYCLHPAVVVVWAVAGRHVSMAGSSHGGAEPCFAGGGRVDVTGVGQPVYT